MTSRASLSMTPAELERFLAEHQVAVVCGHDEDGLLTARRCELQQDGDRLQLTLRPGRRCFDLARQPTVCVSVDTYPSHAEIKGVIITGPAVWQGASAVMDVAVKNVVSFDFSKESS